MAATIFESSKWQAVHDLEPGGDEPLFPLYVTCRVQFAETGWSARLEEVRDSAVVGREYPITLDLIIFEVGAHDAGAITVNVRWDTTEAPPVDRVLVRWPALHEPLVLIPITPT